ncbi:hypothetical protein SAMN05518849_10851 [Sphingobium sp. AP50]|uniref:hypothetical protein n=1 Tax=Sphingobium sp. AP50 TaxID=1884369 RepID=UPI0008AD22CD|nr:hypothetical protein [Sphingobium sp. AP50]SEJ53426.1 hypothetical protein SAMN05518849_10851 [Sphingobium sp. AP50]
MIVGLTASIAPAREGAGRKSAHRKGWHEPAKLSAVMKLKVGSLTRTLSVRRSSCQEGFTLMLTYPSGSTLDPSLRVLALPFHALGAAGKVHAGDGLPAGAFDVASANLVIAATPCSAPLFRPAIDKACRRTDRDVMLVRTGLFPETLDPVSVDLALSYPGGPLIINDLAFMRRSDGSLWLVPQRLGPFVEIRTDGLALTTTPPFATWDERCDGTSRAASQIVRIVNRRGAF